MPHASFQPVSEVELHAVQGGGILSWIGKVVEAVERVVRCIGRPCT